MKTIATITNRFGELLDRLAGLILASVMLLVVANILLRSLFKRPILGTYELVGYCTAAAIGLSLAFCAAQGGHIAVGILVDRLPARMRTLIELCLNLPILGFLGLAAYQLFCHGKRVIASGEVSPTTELPFYPFIFLVAIGFLALTLVFMMRTATLLGREEQS